AVRAAGGGEIPDAGTPTAAVPALTNIRICSCSVFISPWTGWLNTARRSPGWCRVGGGVEGSRHSRERRESGGHRHARTERPAGGRQRGRSSIEAACRRCAARQAGDTGRGRQGGGVSRLQRQQLHHGYGIVR